MYWLNLPLHELDLLVHTLMLCSSYLLTAVEGGYMSRYIPGNQKHLTLEDRKYIEKSINEGLSFKEIARYLCKDPTIISKEIRLHRMSYLYRKGTFYNAHNFCIHRYKCKKTNVCVKIILCGIKCSSCTTCNQHCPDFVNERCDRLDTAHSLHRGSYFRLHGRYYMP